MVQIGKYYRRSWFRTHSSDGSYAALNAPMSDTELRLQRALIGDGVRDTGRWLFAYIVATTIVCAAAAAAAML